MSSSALLSPFPPFSLPPPPFAGLNPSYHAWKLPNSGKCEPELRVRVQLRYTVLENSFISFVLFCPFPAWAVHNAVCLLFHLYVYQNKSNIVDLSRSIWLALIFFTSLSPCRRWCTFSGRNYSSVRRLQSHLRTTAVKQWRKREVAFFPRVKLPAFWFPNQSMTER